MGNQLIFFLVIGSLLGLFGGNAISKLNPFNNSGKVQVIKSESQKEEVFRDRIKGIEYRISEKGTERTPVKATVGTRIGSFVDNFFRAIVTFVLIGLIVLFMTGFNVFRAIFRLRKALRQVVKGIDNAKPKLNGTQNILKDELSKNMDTDSKKVVDEIKRSE